MPSIVKLQRFVSADGTLTPNRSDEVVAVVRRQTTEISGRQLRGYELRFGRGLVAQSLADDNISPDRFAVAIRRCVQRFCAVNPDRTGSSPALRIVLDAEAPTDLVARAACSPRLSHG